MRNISAITGRELHAYFTSPIAYIVTAFFLLVAGLLFSLFIAATHQATLRYLFSDLSTVWLFVIPALTMRLLAEEQRSGTIEMLLTAPVRDYEVAIGKYLAAVGMVLVMVVLTLPLPLLLFLFGDPDPGPILSGYLGLFLEAIAFLAVGLLISALTQNQIVAAVITFALLVALWLANALGDSLSGGGGDVLRYMSVGQHLQDFPRGIIDTKDVVYFLSVAWVGVFLTTVSLQVRRWR